MKLLLTILLIFAVFACSPKKDDTAGASNPLSMDSVRVQVRAFSESYSGIGQLQPVLQVDMVALFEGNFELAEPSKKYYQKGDIIYHLTGKGVEYQKSVYEEARNSAAIEMEYAESILNRKKELYRNHFVSPEQWAELKKNARLAEVHLQKADSAFSFYLNQIDFRAPFPGYVTDIGPEQGAYLQANSFVGRFMNSSQLKLVSVLYQGGFLPQGPGGLSLMLQDTVKVASKLLYAEPSIDPQTGGREAWFEIAAVPGGLLPGQWIHYKLDGPPHYSPAIPEDALLMHDNKYWVMTIGKHRPVSKNVKIGGTSNGWVEIKGGLKSGEWVITRGAYELFYQESGTKFKAED